MTARGAFTLSSLAALVALVAASPGCENNCFRDPHMLGTFRVLGVQAEPPNPEPGGRATLTLATADARPRPVQVAWHLCPTPLGTGAYTPYEGVDHAVPDCLRVPAFATGNTAEITMPTDAFRPGAGVLVSVVGYACAGGTIVQNADELTPRCVGGDAQGFTFTRTIRSPEDYRGGGGGGRGDGGVDPRADGGRPIDAGRPDRPVEGPVINPVFAAVLFGPRGQTAAITVDAPPVVQHCADPSDDGARCEHFVFTPQVTVDGQPSGDLLAGLNYVVDLATPVYTQTMYPGAAPMSSRCPLSSQSQSWDEIEWIPPDHPGTAHIFFFMRGDGDTFAWTERRVIVQ